MLCWNFHLHEHFLAFFSAFFPPIEFFRHVYKIVGCETLFAETSKTKFTTWSSTPLPQVSAHISDTPHSQSGSVNKYHGSRKTRAWLCPTTFNSMQVAFWPKKTWNMFHVFCGTSREDMHCACHLISFHRDSGNVQGVGLKWKYKHNVFTRLWL